MPRDHMIDLSSIASVHWIRRDKCRQKLTSKRNPKPKNPCSIVNKHRPFYISKNICCHAASWQPSLLANCPIRLRSSIPWWLICHRTVDNSNISPFSIVSVRLFEAENLDCRIGVSPNFQPRRVSLRLPFLMQRTNKSYRILLRKKNVCL